MNDNRSPTTITSVACLVRMIVIGEVASVIAMHECDDLNTLIQTTSAYR